MIFTTKSIRVYKENTLFCFFDKRIHYFVVFFISLVSIVKQKTDERTRYQKKRTDWHKVHVLMLLIS